MRLRRRLQLLLQNYHSTALLLFNYCTLTNVSYFLSSPLLCFYMPLLVVSPFSSIGQFCLFRQNLWGHSGAADVRNIGSAGRCNIDTHKDTLIYGICSAMCTPTPVGMHWGTMFKYYCAIQRDDRKESKGEVGLTVACLRSHPTRLFSCFDFGGWSWLIQGPSLWLLLWWQQWGAGLRGVRPEQGTGFSPVTKYSISLSGP